MSTTATEPIQVGALTICFRVDPETSGGTQSVFEFHVPAGARVPAPHSHDAFDETIYGLTGTLTFIAGGVPHEIGPGDALFVPRGVVHGFEARAGDAAALAIATPGRFGPDYFRELAAVLGAAAGGPPDQDAVFAVMRRHGLTPARPA